VSRRRDGHARKTADSDRYQADTDGYRPDAGDEPGDTREHPSDTEGYPTLSADEGAPQAEGEARQVQPQEWWARAGYPSFQAYLQELDESQDKMFGRRKPRSELPTPGLGSPEAPARGAAGMKTRQVCLKISERDYEELSEAAAMFSARPTTLARMLVRRGVRAIIDADEPES